MNDKLLLPKTRAMILLQRHYRRKRLDGEGSNMAGDP